MIAQDAVANGTVEPTTVPTFDQLIPTRLYFNYHGQDGELHSTWGWKWDDSTPRLVLAQVRQAWRDAPREADTVIEMRGPDGSPVLDDEGNTRVVFRKGEVTEIGLERVRTLVLCALCPDLSPLDADRFGAAQVDGILRYLEYLKDEEPDPKAPTTTDQTEQTGR
jgi:hypothetical protein